ncbi:MAG: (deoxy)nucleoside triphosphate pyrophosphohydrolase [Thermoplasmata archaeon]|nr:(deoxy)nucleoside triphosphate pyrophosphohydrolase [Thermoplasmata archaeon]
MVEVAAGIVVSDGRILCFRKGPSKYPYLSGRFEFPGGKLEDGETPEQALVREFREELDSDISGCPMERLTSYVHDYPDFSVTLHFIVVRSDGFSCTLREHTETVAVPPGDLTGVNWADGDRKAAEIIAGRGHARRRHP